MRPFCPTCFSRRRLLTGLAGLGASGLLPACQHNDRIDRSQLNFIPDSWMVTLSEQTWSTVLAQSRQVRGTPLNAALARVGRRIADVSDLGMLDWQFVILDSPQPNAFVLPGGKVAVYTGLFPFTETEAQLAAVIGHEAGHVAARHGNERLSQQLTFQSTAVLANLYFWGRLDFATRRLLFAVLGLGFTYGILLPYSRSHEIEADVLGVTYMARAGYDPRAAVGFWENMMAARSGWLASDMLSTHPADDKRIRAIEAEYDRVLPMYEGNRRT